MLKNIVIKHSLQSVRKKSSMLTNQDKLFSKVKIKFIKNNNIITNYGSYQKKDKYSRFKTPFLYIYPFATMILYGRNTMTYYPLNLIPYQCSGLVINYFFRNTFLVVVLYMFLIFCIIFNKNLDKEIRYHGVLANFLDLLMIILFNFKSAVSPYARWSYLQPLTDCFVYTLISGMVLYCLIYSLRGLLPTLPKSIDGLIKQLLSAEG